ncbi:phenylalanyl-tRNA synthetase alpha subunit, mitochondrial [Malassezia pachydermatis]|uniref:Phenylalanine--tRNA ligase, mitochondrial n=1 Tax=Malassezia pachydermatis TaxID=77020 RepID=A0A0M8MPE9_9BASI|nr:phenylalanyl-trna synthetase [Malassezia pachydermatis]KOS14187.1 phenylalanyl-trna synthetase [Malassezia pachydermatis]
MWAAGQLLLTSARLSHRVLVSCMQDTMPCAQRFLHASVAQCTKPPSLTLHGTTYATDDVTNIPSSIMSRIFPNPKLPYADHHPLALLRQEIERILGPKFTPIRAPSPIVTTKLNFDDLGFPADHPGRSPSDTYYVNRNTCLRTHTSAHEVETFRDGHLRWLLTADVFRRDEIDSSHYPVFHQMEGASVWDLSAFQPGGEVEKECEAMEATLQGAGMEIVDDVDVAEADGWQAHHLAQHPRASQLALRHLKASLNTLVLGLFRARWEQESASEEPLRVRWIPATFPFTAPSFEVEVWFRGKWLEILGTGIVKQRTLDESGIPEKLGWAFGLGLERIAMVLFSIPDIRLFWSQDERFLSQFKVTDNSLVTFKPYSKYPPCYKDVSFWMSNDFHENDLCETVRDLAGDLVEDVACIDDFVHPKTKRQSRCYRINYRSMDRSLENDEVNSVHARVLEALKSSCHIEIR